MKIRLLITIFSLASIIGYVKANTITITGRINNSFIFYPIDRFAICYNEDNYVFCDSMGYFSIQIDDLNAKDTLQFISFTKRVISIINIPNGSDTINLGEIPAFDKTPARPIYEYFGLKWYSFYAHYDVWNFYRKWNKKCRKENKIVDKAIKKYRFQFRNREFLIQQNKNNQNLLLDLSNPID